MSTRTATFNVTHYHDVARRRITVGTSAANLELNVSNSILLTLPSDFSVARLLSLSIQSINSPGANSPGADNRWASSLHIQTTDAIQITPFNLVPLWSHEGSEGTYNINFGSSWDRPFDIPVSVIEGHKLMLILPGFFSTGSTGDLNILGLFHVLQYP